MRLQARLKRLLPARAYNGLMLKLSFLYAHPAVRFESNLDEAGIADLKTLLDATNRLAGDVIECGSSRCGTSILIAEHVRTLARTKRVLALDSFCGFDRLELQRERSNGLTDAPDDAFASTNADYVRRKLDKLDFDGDIVPIEGFFADTLPPIVDDTAFSLALIDCDLQASVRYCATTLWPAIVSGGVMAFDDYDSEEFRGARLAVDAFVRDHASEIVGQGQLNRLYFVRKADGGSRPALPRPSRDG